MKERARRDFYELQSLQWKKSLLVFVALILFYFAAVALISLATVLSLGIFMTDRSFWTSSFVSKLLFFDLCAAALIAFFHFQDARRFGAQYILKRLEAQAPDAADRYHKQFIDTLEEIRIASGVPKVKAYIIPAFAVNSMALIESDGTPAVCVTEGLLAECARDEFQAISAHEMAHIVGGDALFVTLICSLANLFEKFREALVPEEPESQAEVHARGNRIFGPPLIYLAVTFSSLIMGLLSMLISRQRELLADAAAVEYSRDPLPLARALYKAQLNNSFIGDFTTSYNPIFIVPPDSHDIPDGFLGRAFNSHPPIMKRIKLLAEMADKRSDDIIRQVWESRRAREQGRSVLHSFEELKAGLVPGSSEATTSMSDRSAGDIGSSPADSGEMTSQASRIWFVKSPDGAWKGPLAIDELISLPFFTSWIMVRNEQERIEAKAREFPHIRMALHGSKGKERLHPNRRNQCPRCRVPLVETYYEGVPMKMCRHCLGKLIDMSLIDRIIARKEVMFSTDLIGKATVFKERFLSGPIKTKKISDKPPLEPLICPDCGNALIARPYNYSYVLPVDKCLSCHKIWFDADELEILQALIENR